MPARAGLSAEGFDFGAVDLMVCDHITQETLDGTRYIRGAILYTCIYTVYVRESGNRLMKVEIGVWLQRHDKELIDVKTGATDCNMVPYLTVIISSI